jgi:hypothetical protein
MLHACLYTICFVFCYTSWRFYAFSRTNPLMRCHSASSLFLLFLCFKKATSEIFLELDETKARIPIFPEASRSPKQRRRGARRRLHHGMARAVGTPDCPSGIPDMHTIHDPMISVSWIHISELIKELHHPLQYQIIYLQLVTWPRLRFATQGKFTTEERISSSVDDPRHAYYPTGNWLGDVPSSHWHRRIHHHLPCSLLHSLTKLIARDKAVSTFWIVLANHLREE